MQLLSSLAHLFHPRRSNNHRPRVLHPIAFVYLALVMVGFAGLLNSLSLLPDKYQSILGFASSITPNQVIDRTNAQRAQNGLPPLTANAQLTQAALAKGQDMMNDQYWAHVAPDGKQPWAFISESGYKYKVAGENLARDFSNTDDMVTAWMASPTHRANILNNKYNEIGIAVIDGTLEGYETTLVVQMFGSPQAAVAQVSPVAEKTASPSPAASPVTSPAPEAMNQPAVEETEVANPTVAVVAEPESDARVLAGALIPLGELQVPPLFTPLQLSKALFLSLIMMIISTLVYDSFVIGHRSTMRLVGKNLGHILFFSAIAFLLILFKGGIVG